MFMESLDQSGDPMSTRSASRFTDKQGQYLAFIATYVSVRPKAPKQSAPGARVGRADRRASTDAKQRTS
jgi:hypothetical protein